MCYNTKYMNFRRVHAASMPPNTLFYTTCITNNTTRKIRSTNFGWDRGKVLCYKSEGCRFDSRWCQWIFRWCKILPITLWPWVRPTLQQKGVPGAFPGGKGSRWIRLTLPLSCAVVIKSGNLNFLEPSGPLQACNGTALPLQTLGGKMFRQNFMNNLPSVFKPEIQTHPRWLQQASIVKYQITANYAAKIICIDLWGCFPSLDLFYDWQCSVISIVLTPVLASHGSWKAETKMDKVTILTSRYMHGRVKGVILTSAGHERFHTLK